MNTSKNQPRQPKGQIIAGRSVGGEWAAHLRQPASLTYAPLSASEQQREEIIHKLASDGYVPASTVESATNPRYTDGIDTWWAQHYERMEQSTDGKTFEVLPDDFTIMGTSGRALSGKRRTHRIRYSGAGVELRMPSATAIRRFSQLKNDQTFDVPVEMEHEGGKISGFVRVTKGAAGAWEVQALGFPGQSAGRVSESVAAILESRRPSLALREAEAQFEAQRKARAEGLPLPTLGGASALHQRRIDRLARSGAQMVSPRVPSAVVQAAAFDPGTNTMTISLNGRKYGYRVSKETFQEVMNSDSPGRAYNELVKNQADRVEVTECRKCRRWTNAQVKHVCPAVPKQASSASAFRKMVGSILLSSLARKSA